jgi:serine/threonine protein kinase
MSADTLCPTCGKKVYAGRSGSLTQWLFTEDSCECAGKVLKLKLSEDELSVGSDATRMCNNCGKLRGSSRQGSLTQWVFSAERCNCDFEKLNPGDLFDGRTNSSTGLSDAPFSVDVDSDLIDELELGEINYHGLSPESFPFERYRVISEKGRGAGGVVYEAWDCMLRKRVAIKTMFSYQWSAEELMRFQSEARAASKLNHPNVLQIIDFGASTSGQPYMVLEFVDGTTLKELIDQDGPIPFRDALPFFLQICDGLGHAHQQGIFHRDVKCSNIMIGKNRNSEIFLKVIDFGMAALVHAPTLGSDSVEAQALTIVGSPLYMSPDQMHGDKFDARSEIYSVGCVMFETLCGMVPFDGDSVIATMSMHVNSPVPELRDVHDEPIDCHPQLAEIITKCLAKHPDDRFQTIDELHDELAELQSRIAIERVDTKISSEVLDYEKRARANRIVKNSVAFIGAAVIVAAVGFTSYRIISAMPAPEVVPSTSAVEIYDKEDSGTELSTKRRELFDGLTSDRLSANYHASTHRLIVDGTANADAIIDRALKQKLFVKELELFNVSLSPAAFSKLHLLAGLACISAQDVECPENSDWLKPCVNLKVLRLHDLKPDPDFYKILSQIRGLKHLEFDGSAITAEGLATLRTLPLEILSLRMVPLTTEHVKQIAKFKNLNALYVGDTGISDGDINLLSADLKRLATFGLNGTPITDATLLDLAKTRITTLYIFRCNHLSRIAIRKFKIMKPSVQILDDQSDLQGSFAPAE